MCFATTDSTRTTAAIARGAWLPPALALLVGSVVALFLPFGVGVIIATIFPTCVIAVLLGLVVMFGVLRWRPARSGEMVAYSGAWLVAAILTTVFGRLVLYSTGISVSPMPPLRRVLLDLAAAAPTSVTLVAVMVIATIVITPKPTSAHSDH